MRWLLNILLVLLVGNTASAHPGHTQVTEVEWNAKSGRFEVAMKLNAVALEDSVSLGHGKRFRLESSASVEDALAKWLPRHFQIHTGKSSERGSIRWVGHELELHTVWLFFEYIPAAQVASPQAVGLNQPRQPRADGGSGTSDVKVENRCLFDVRPETSHLVSLRSGQSVQQRHCDGKQPLADFSVRSRPEKRGSRTIQYVQPTTSRSHTAR